RRPVRLSRLQEEISGVIPARARRPGGRRIFRKRTTGRKLPHVSTAVVLHPEIDRKYFYLICGTRNPKGVEVFKQAEKSAMLLMEGARVSAQIRKRERATGQMELRIRTELGAVGEYYKGLRIHYLTQSKQVIHGMLLERRTVPYDDAW